MDVVTPARRVASLAELTQPGDYCGPTIPEDSTDQRPRVHFLLPIARDEGVEPGGRSVFGVASPPHVFRECPDGSLEIRESIAAYGSELGTWLWHGYLDEGHRWRQV